MARDEEGQIEGCLKTLRFADVVLVVDTGSVDRTVAVARKLADRVIRIPWRGFADGRNAGIEALKTDWILMMDADERIPPELAQEIRQAIATPGAPAGFRIPLVEHFFGRPLTFMSGDPKLRLFRRGAGRCNEKALHEGVEVAGPVGMLVRPFDHHGHGTIRRFLDKIQRDATIEATALDRAGIQPSAYDMLFRPIQRFWKHWVVRGGFRDGVPGFVACAGFAFLQFAIALSLWERRGCRPAGWSLLATLFRRQRRLRARVFGGEPAWW